jgi:hypothetical protein
MMVFAVVGGPTGVMVETMAMHGSCGFFIQPLFRCYQHLEPVKFFQGSNFDFPKPGFFA